MRIAVPLKHFDIVASSRAMARVMFLLASSVSVSVYSADANVAVSIEARLKNIFLISFYLGY